MILLLIVVTVITILAFVAVLGSFLNKISKQLTSISRTLSKIAFGVRAVETQCLVIGPAADALNPVLAEMAAGVEQVAIRAERLVS